jgi:transposase
MDCRHIEFSPEKSQERINKALQVFPHRVLMCILGFTLHLLGAKRKAIAELADLPEESVKTLVRRVCRDGFPALRDRRLSEASPVASAPPSQLQIIVQQDKEGLLVEFGSHGSRLRIPANHRVHSRTVVLSLLNARVLSLVQSASVLGICEAHCRELARKLANHDVTDVLVDKREGQKQDFRVGPEQKAELIEQLAARAITGHDASSQVLAEQVTKQTGVGLSARTIRWHIRHLGLSDIRKSLPQLVETLKKTPPDCD